MRIGLLQAIYSLLPTAEISVTMGDQASEDKVKWHNPSESPFTDEELLAEVDKLQAEHDSLEYARNRKEEYPSTDDLIVALWENVVEERASAVISLEAARQAVKTKYPKP